MTSPLESRIVTLFGGDKSGFETSSNESMKFNGISGLRFDENGILWICDVRNNIVRQIDFERAVCLSIWGNPLQTGFVNGDKRNALFYWPFGLEISNTTTTSASSSNEIYISDMANHAIRVLNPKTEQVWTLAGTGVSGHKDGEGKEAQFNRPFGIALDRKANRLFVADFENHVIRVILLNKELGYPVSTLIGTVKESDMVDGIGLSAKLCSPNLVRIFPSDVNYLFVTSWCDHTVRRVDLNTLKVETICGDRQLAQSGGTSVQKRTPHSGFRDGELDFYSKKTMDADDDHDPLFKNIYDVAFDVDGNMFVAESGNNSIRKVSSQGKVSTILACPDLTEVNPSVDGFLLDEATLVRPRWLHIEKTGNLLIAQQFSLRRMIGVAAPDPSVLLVGKRLFRIARLLFCCSSPRRYSSTSTSISNQNQQQLQQPQLQQQQQQLIRKISVSSFSGFNLLVSRVLSSLCGNFLDKSSFKVLVSVLSNRSTIGRYLKSPKDIQLFLCSLSLGQSFPPPSLKRKRSTES